MNKILIITHGELAGAFKETPRLFFGDQADRLMTLSLNVDDNPMELKERLSGMLSDEDAYLIFVDLYGGTPCNVVALLMAENNQNISCITGANLPLIMEAMGMLEHKAVGEVVTELMALYPNTIINLRQQLGLDI